MAAVPNYSPWQGASDVVSGVGQNLNQVALGVARLKYQQAMNQQRQAVALGQLALRQHLTDAQTSHLSAQTDELGAKTANDKAKLDISNKLGLAMRSKYPTDMSQGPTNEAAKSFNLQDIAEQAGRSAGLGNEAYRLLMPHNVSQNQIATDPITGGMQSQGPVVLPQGSMYQLPGGKPIVNPKPFLHNIPAGAMAVDASGVKVAEQPAKPNMQHLGNVLPQLLRMYDGGGIQAPGPKSTPTEINLYSAMTNLLNKVVEPSSGSSEPNVANAGAGASGSGKPIDADTARAFLKQAGGDRDKARKLAKDAGYTF